MKFPNKGIEAYRFLYVKVFNYRFNRIVKYSDFLFPLLSTLVVSVISALQISHKLCSSSHSPFLCPASASGMESHLQEKVTQIPRSHFLDLFLLLDLSSIIPHCLGNTLMQTVLYFTVSLVILSREF